MTPKKDIKIAFWGTPEFALPILEALFENGYNLVAVITNPDKPAGRKNIITPPPTKIWARQNKIEVLQPHILTNYKLQITNYKPDLFVVAAYGKIIPKEIIDLPKYGSLNIHPSLLPRWRGPSPIQYTILNGDTETGVTIIKMDEKMDHGSILVKRELANYKLQITNYKITYKELHDKLAKLGAELLIETLPKWINGEIKPVEQNEAGVTYSKMLTKDDGRIDWSQSAEKIERMVRAFTPWPGAWTVWPSDKKFGRLRIEKADFIEEESAEGSPGYIWQAKNCPLLVKTGHGSLVIKKLTPEGKKSMSVEDFLRGHPQIAGGVLI